MRFSEAHFSAMIVENGTVTHLAVEAPGKLEVSAAEAILEAL